MRLPNGQVCRNCTPIMPCSEHEYLDPALAANVPHLMKKSNKKSYLENWESMNKNFSKKQAFRALLNAVEDGEERIGKKLDIGDEYELDLVDLREVFRAAILVARYAKKEK